MLTSSLSKICRCRRVTAAVRRGIAEKRAFASIPLLFGPLSEWQTTQRIKRAWTANTDPTVVGFILHCGTSVASLTKSPIFCWHKKQCYVILQHESLSFYVRKASEVKHTSFEVGDDNGCSDKCIENNENSLTISFVWSGVFMHQSICQYN
jgi:hypothetical protein